MIQYPAILRPCDQTGFEVEFPDFRQARCAASELETARLLAEASLYASIEELAARGCALPTPSRPDAGPLTPHGPQAITILIDVAGSPAPRAA